MSEAVLDESLLHSPMSPAAPDSPAAVPVILKQFEQIGHGFWNLRSKFIIKGIDIGTHMSICRLPNGKYMVIDTCELTPDVKQDIDVLTDNGALIECVIATHPFHTVYFAPFYEIYPNTNYYGTPRHLKSIGTISWAGDLQHEEVRTKFEPDIQMRIPDGCEFVNPNEDNHFASVFVFHQPSRTIHVDDTVMFFANPSCILSCIFCLRPNTMAFHPTIRGIGLNPNKEAPGLFKAWIEQIMADWDFDNICAAHTSNKIGGAKDMLAKTLHSYQGTFDKLVQQHSR